MTAEEQAMSYPGQKVDPEESLGSGPGSGIGPGSVSQPQRYTNLYYNKYS